MKQINLIRLFKNPFFKYQSHYKRDFIKYKVLSKRHDSFLSRLDGCDLETRKSMDTLVAAIDLCNDESTNARTLKYFKFVEKKDEDIEVLWWPFRRKATEDFQVNILNKDAFRLNNGELLNDSLVNFGTHFYVPTKCLESSTQDNVYTFSTLFSSKLIDELPDNCFQRYRRVNRWVQKIDVFKKQFICFPIHAMERCHFFLICYVNVSAVLNGVDRNCDSFEGPEPCILIFDSIKLKKKSTYNKRLDALNEYLVLHWMASNFEMEDWCCGLISQKTLQERMKKMMVYVMSCPQQPCGDVSCGVYVIRNVTNIAKLQPCLNQESLNSCEIITLPGFDYAYDDILEDRDFLFATISSLIPKYESSLQGQEEETFEAVDTLKKTKKKRKFISSNSTESNIIGYADLRDSPIQARVDTLDENFDITYKSSYHITDIVKIPKKENTSKEKTWFSEQDVFMSTLEYSF